MANWRWAIKRSLVNKSQSGLVKESLALGARTVGSLALLRRWGEVA